MVVGFITHIEPQSKGGTYMARKITKEKYIQLKKI